MRRVAVIVVVVLVAALAGCGWFGRKDETKGKVEADAGGSIRTGEGVRVAFPPGALSENTEVRVRPVAEPPAMVAGATLVGPAVDVTIGKATLRSSAEITFPLATPVGPDEHVFVATWSADGTWTSAGGALVVLCHDPRRRWRFRCGKRVLQVGQVPLRRASRACRRRSTA